MIGTTIALGAFPVGIVVLVFVLASVVEQVDVLPEDDDEPPV